jgi:hypothetical protein
MSPLEEKQQSLIRVIPEPEGRAVDGLLAGAAIPEVEPAMR